MIPLFLYNTLSRRKEQFKPVKSKKVGLYTCGPTVYNYAHLGNLRTYVFEDLLKRALLYNGYQVKHVMNITDVGHLIGDQDMGEDKIEAGAKREGKSAWDVANFYTKAFENDLQKLNILEPDIWCKATDNIKEQINLVKILEKKSYTYKTSDGIYFDTAKIKDYNKLSHMPLRDLQEGARVEKNTNKKNPTDFALWKFSYPKGRFFDSAQDDDASRRQMEWDSPWGIGFPGWHLECSAMSLKYLEKNLDIHCGGIDHINIHHTNEIAQSETATGKKFFNFWLHGAFLNIVGGKKMAKSADNFLTLDKALLKNKISPLVFRFSCLQVHYRKPMEYSPKIMEQATAGLAHLHNQISNFQFPISKQFPISNYKKNINFKFKIKFLEAINDDLNLPKALAITQEVIKSSLPIEEKLSTILDFDQVLSLDLSKNQAVEKIPTAVKTLLQQRQQARQAKDWPRADDLRQQIEARGYKLEDGPQGLKLLKK